MSTTQEKISALKEALASGTKTVTIGDRSVTYRDVEEIQKILVSLQSDLSSGSATSPFSVTQVNYTRGL